MNSIHNAVVAFLQRQEFMKFMRFLTVGVSNTLISFLTYLASLALLPKEVWTVSFAQVISYSVGILWSYIWNRIWVFESSDHVAKEGGRFLTVQITLMLVSAGLIGFIVTYFDANRVWAWIIVMAFITILNYALMRLWAFRNFEVNKINRH